MARRNAADGSMATTWMRAARPGAGRQPATHRGGVPAVHDTEDPTGVGVHDGRHPRLDPTPATVLVAEPADPAVAVLVDAEPPHPLLVDVGQQHRGGVDGGLHRPPRHPELEGHLRHCPARVDHRRQRRRPQPGCAAASAR